MMPTRLQDGLSISLLQWMRSAEVEATRSVVVRISDMDSLEQVMVNLGNAGMTEMKPLTGSTLSGKVTAEVLSRVVRCLGVCSVTSQERE